MRWDALERTLDRVVDELLARDVHQQPFSQGKLIPRHDYISLYEQIYNLLCQERGCANKYGNKLFEKYEQLVQRSIHIIFQTQVKSEERKGPSVGSNNLMGKGEEGIETFLENLKIFKQKMYVFSHTFSYMERYFIPRESLPTLEEVANTQLTEQVIKRATQQLKNELAALAEKRRDGKPVNDALFPEVVALFVELNGSTNGKEEEDKEEGEEIGAYEDLEAFLLHKTTLFYAKKAPQWPQDTLEKKVEQALLYERDFAEKFLLEKSVAKFEEGLKKVMQDVITMRNRQKDEKKLGISFENNASAPSLACSTLHKIREDATKSNIADAFRTTNV